jgi:hypothetical protein
VELLVCHVHTLKPNRLLNCCLVALNLERVDSNFKQTFKSVPSTMGFGRAFGRVFGCWNPQRHRKSSTYGIQSRDRNAKVPANVTLSESDSRSVRSYLIDSVSFVSEAPSRSIHFDEWSYSVVRSLSVTNYYCLFPNGHIFLL